MRWCSNERKIVQRRRRKTVKKNKTRLVVFCGLLTATAYVLGYVESLIPFSLGVAGIKVGLANIVSLFALSYLGPVCAISVLLARIVLSAITYSGMSAMVYSLAGGLLSFLVMYLLSLTHRFSTTGLGIAGGVAHNIGQLIMASLMLGRAITAYLPVLLTAGALAGLLVGLAAGAMDRHFPKKYFS